MDNLTPNELLNVLAIAEVMNDPNYDAMDLYKRYYEPAQIERLNRISKSNKQSNEAEL